MSRIFGRKLYALVGVVLAHLSAIPAIAADIGGSAEPQTALGALASDQWEISFTPYGWLTSLKGTQTVRGRSSHVDASFIDLVRQSDALVAVMGTVEARRGPLALYSDIVWTRLGVSGASIRTRGLSPGVTTSVGQSLSLNIEMTIIETGAAYEISRSNALSFDLIGGARYWGQKANFSYEASISTDIGDLERIGSRAFARSGSVQWLDPFVGARMRFTPAAGRELFLRGDIGGFGAASKFSWQAITGYGFNLGAYRNMIFSGLIGYRALSVNFVKGSGTSRYEYDMLQHGPVLALNIRF